MRARFDDEYIRSELERIGDHLDDPLTVYLIGGGSMAFRDRKDATKDIDLVVTDGDALGQFQTVLLECGYEIVKEPGAAMEEQSLVDEGTGQATIGLPIPAPEPDLFRHKATNDILRLLLDNPYDQFTIRELSRLTDNATQSVKRAVDVLEPNGIVDVRPGEFCTYF